MWVVVYGRGERFFGVSLCIAARSGADDMRSERVVSMEQRCMRALQTLLDPPERLQSGIS